MANKQTSYIPNANTVVYLPLNGNSNDASGNGNNGVDTSISYVGGIFNQAGSFNGSTSKITLPANAQGGNDVTISMWFNVNPGYTGVPNLYSSSNSAFINPYLNTGGGIGVNNKTTGSSYSSFNSATGLYSSGQPVHFLYTYNSTSGFMTVYINGQNVINVLRGGNQQYNNAAGENCIGVYSFSGGASGGGYFPGTIDDFFIENQPWTQDMVTSYYGNAIGGASELMMM